jgi:syntaxin 16
MQRSLATDLQSLSVELRKKQSTYLKRLRLQKEVRERLFFVLHYFSFIKKENKFQRFIGTFYL